MAKKRKMNPRRIPISNDEKNQNKIVEEAMHNDMLYAWLLVANSIIGLNLMTPDELQELSVLVNLNLQKKFDTMDLIHAEDLMGISYHPNLQKTKVQSPFDLEKLKKKIRKIALYTALSVICLGINESGKFTKDDIRNIFFDVDLTIAEIENGINSYDQLKEQLERNQVSIQIDPDDKCNISLDPKKKKTTN